MSTFLTIVIPAFNEKSNFKKGVLKKVVKYLKAVRAELKKVSWPKRGQVLRLTIVVVLITTVVSLYLGTLDLIFAKIFAVLIK